MAGRQAFHSGLDNELKVGKVDSINKNINDPDFVILAYNLIQRLRIPSLPFSV